MHSRGTQILLLGGVAVAAAFAIAVAVALLSGDATASKADYQATVVTARDRVDFVLARITKSDSTEELITRIDEASAVVGATAKQLDDAGVAEGFETDNDRLVQRLRAFSDELAGTAAQFEDPTFAAALQGVTSLSFKQWNNVNMVLTDMKADGLQVEPLGRH